MYTCKIHSWMFRNNIDVVNINNPTGEELKFIMDNAIPNEVTIKYKASIIHDYFESSSAEDCTHIAILATAKSPNKFKLLGRVLYIFGVTDFTDDEIASEIVKYYLTFCNDSNKIYNPTVENWINEKDYFEIATVINGADVKARVSLRFVKMTVPIFCISGILKTSIRRIATEYNDGIQP